MKVEEITEDIKKESSSLSQNHAKKGYNPGPMEKDSLYISVLRMLTDVNKDLLDENGEPKVLYHGTNNEFDTFDIN